MGLLRALRNRGMRVQPFKCGPDYIDTLFHRIASGSESVNLDTFMSSPEHVKDLYAHYGRHSDVCVTEGAMGLFDGYDGAKGSAAEVAMLLKVPVLLLVSSKSIAYSVAPLIFGFRQYCPELQLAGVVFNYVGSDSQYHTLQQACNDVGVTCYGYMGRCPDLVIPSRHLGLSVQHKEQMERLVESAACEVEQHVDIEQLLKFLKQ